MKFFEEILANHMLFAAVAAWAISQILKVFTNLCIARTWDVKRLFGDGGMPSAHSATVVALAVMCGYIYGFDGAEFAIAFIFAVVVMRDAIGVRRETGKQAKAIKEIANSLSGDADGSIDTDELKVLVGHTPLQVVCGAVLGCVVATLYILIVL